jgi:succinate dehydrogenase flavin-adding protein (antitoxin of CptAB toxin-antitoxin module)
VACSEPDSIISALFWCAQLLNSLSYRAKQRGFLELDLLVARAPRMRASLAFRLRAHSSHASPPACAPQGGWAEEQLPHLSDEELAAFAVVLDAENPDLFKWLTSQTKPPDEMAANPAYVKLHAHVAAHLAAHAQGATRAAAGKDWVRGWGDSGFPSSGNQQ